MASPRKLFRIEQMTYETGLPPAEPAGFMPEEPTPAASMSELPVAMPMSDDEAVQRHYELITEIKSLRALMAGRDEEAHCVMEAYRAQIAEIQKIKDELAVINAAIDRTKHEIATLHVTGFHNEESRVKHELDAVVAGTEQATQTILNMCEDIDQFATTLIESGKDDAEHSLGRAIQNRVVHVFEACNFQDITGQRISKVVGTWKFIELHVARMMEIWGGVDAFKHIVPEAPPERKGDEKLLNGPKLDGEDGHVSQDDIDALFK